MFKRPIELPSTLPILTASNSEIIFSLLYRKQFRLFDLKLIIKFSMYLAWRSWKLVVWSIDWLCTRANTILLLLCRAGSFLWRPKSDVVRSKAISIKCERPCIRWKVLMWVCVCGGQKKVCWLFKISSQTHTWPAVKLVVSFPLLEFI